MERAVAVLVGGVGVVLLTLAAVAWGAPQGEQGGGVDVLALRPERGWPPTVTSAVTSTSRGPGAEDGGVAPARPASSLPATTASPPALEPVLSEIASGAIRFEVGRAELDAPARELLARLAAGLVAHPGVVVQVRGHTDSTGTVTFNRELSARRAGVVVELLVSLGVPRHQLVAVGVGPAEPVADNATAEGRQANRRSEVLVEETPP